MARWARNPVWWPDRRLRIRRIPVRCARDRELRYWTLRLAWLAAALLAVALLGQVWR